MPNYIKSDSGDMFKPPDQYGEMPKRESSDIGRRLAEERRHGDEQGKLSPKPKNPTESSFLGDTREQFKKILPRGLIPQEREITPSEKTAESVRENNTKQYHEAQRTLEKADQATQKEWGVFRMGQDDIKQLYEQQRVKISELHDHISKQIDIRINYHQEEIKKARITKNQGETTTEPIKSLNEDFETYMNDFRSRQNGRWENLKEEQNKQRIKLDARLANGLNALNAKDKLEALPTDLPPQEQDKIAELKKAHVDEIEALSAKNIKEIDELSVPGNVSPPETLSREREKSIEELPKRDFKERMEKIVNKHYEEWVKLENLQKGEYEKMDPSNPFDDKYEDTGPSNPFDDKYEDTGPSNPFDDKYEDMG